MNSNPGPIENPLFCSRLKKKKAQEDIVAIENKNIEKVRKEKLILFITIKTFLTKSPNNQSKRLTLSRKPKESILLQILGRLATPLFDSPIPANL